MQTESSHTRFEPLRAYLTQVATQLTIWILLYLLITILEEEEEPVLSHPLFTGVCLYSLHTVLDFPLLRLRQRIGRHDREAPPTHTVNHYHHCNYINNHHGCIHQLNTGRNASLTYHQPPLEQPPKQPEPDDSYGYLPPVLY